MRYSTGRNFQRGVKKRFATENQIDKMPIKRFWRSLRSIDLQNTKSVYYRSIQSFQVLMQKIRAEEYAIASNKKGHRQMSDQNNRKEKLCTKP